MTHDSKQRGKTKQAETPPAPASPDQDGDESLPEILEVFGAEPLVPGENSADTAASDEAEVEDSAPASTDDEPSAADDDASVDVDVAWDLDASTTDPFFAGADRVVSRPDVAGDAPAAASGDANGQRALQRSCDMLVEQLSLSEERLARIETSVEELARQTSFLPPKLRGLGSKVDDLTHGLGDERTRSLLESLVSVIDLLDAARARFDPNEEQPTAGEARRYFDAIYTSIGQMLEVHHVTEIQIDGEFDPALHHAVERVPVSQAEQDGTIVSVVRRGWIGGGRVLRYADVSVGSLQATAESGESATNDDSTKNQEAVTHDLDQSELDALTPPPGEAPKTVTDTDSASITFRPTPRKTHG